VRKPERGRRWRRPGSWLGLGRRGRRIGLRRLPGGARPPGGDPGDDRRDQLFRSS